ncbi:MAG: hypothetical protein R2867_43365 [Caldilineaceae bacterium]
MVKAGERPAADVEIEIVNLNAQHEPMETVAKSERSPTEEAAQEQGHSWFRWPRRNRNKSTWKLPSTPELPTIKIKEQVSATRRHLTQIITLPLQVLRPFREIITAIGVIGALSMPGALWLSLAQRESKDRR